MRRRAVLAAVTAGLGGIAGCSALTGGGSERTPYGVPDTTADDAGDPTRTTATPTAGGTAGTADGSVSVSYVVETTDALAFDPAEVRIEPGDAVLWLNTGSVPHTVTADAVPDGAEYFASGGFADELAAREGYPDGAIEVGDSYTHTFEVEGRYEYFCIPHEGAGMRGRIGVGVDLTVPDPTPHFDVRMTRGLRFVPGTIRVLAGTEVVWLAIDDIPHSVTAYEDGIPEGADYWASGGFESEAAARGAWPEGWIEGGERFAHTFSTPGTHRYFCIPHEGAGMTGTVEVVPDDGGTTTGDDGAGTTDTRGTTATGSRTTDGT